MAVGTWLLRLVVGSALLAIAYAECIDCEEACGNAKVDLVFVVDGSGSICSNQEVSQNCRNWNNMLNFLVSIVDHMNISPDTDRVAFVQFGNVGKKEFGFTNYATKSRLKNAIRNINHLSQNTNTSGGIRVMRTQLFNTPEDRPDVPNVAILVTDGKSTYDNDRTIPEAERANDEGIKTYSIGVTSSVDEQEVRLISSPPQQVNQTYWLLRGFDVLATSMAVTRQIFQAFCNSEGPREVIVPNSVGCPVSNSHRWEQQCYLYRSTARTWGQAEADCVTLSGHLVGFTSAAQHTYISGLMPQYGAQTIWTGGKVSTNKHWTYVTNGRILQGQGCYDDDEFTRDLGYKTPSIDNLTPQKCIDACRQAGYKYAGVQAGLHCFCGSDFGRYGLVQGCTVACPGDSRYKCGGFQANYIYLVDGAWGEWSENQPNNFGNNQDCGALYYTHQYKYADEDCSRAYQYLCHIPENQVCTGSTSDGRFAQSIPESNLQTAKCYFIGEKQKSWTAARADCFARGGDLATLMTSSDYLAMARMLDTVTWSQQGLYMWVGVNKKSFSWTLGSYMSFTQWAAGSPSSVPTSDEGCVRMSSSDGYRWRDETCSRTYSYFCQFDILTTTTTSTTTTTTPAPTTTTTTPPTTTTIAPTTTTVTTQPSTAPTSTSTPLGPGEPDLGASTDVNGSNSTLMILLALLIILIVVMVITICLLIYFNYMRRNMLVGVAGGLSEQQTKTIKYNIYEPPAYEEITVPISGDTSQYHPNLSPPALSNYKLSKTHTEEVAGDYNVSAHVYAIQEEADRRATTGRKKLPDHSTEAEERRAHKKSHKKRDKFSLRKSKKREEEEEDSESRDSSPRRSRKKSSKDRESRGSSSQDRY